jgi:hypothetical protein
LERVNASPPPTRKGLEIEKMRGRKVWKFITWRSFLVWCSWSFSLYNLA